MIDLLWPDVPLDVGCNRLRQALSTLRSVLEPPDGAAVLLADRRGVRLVAGSLGCDVPVFNEALRRGDVAAAARVYGGDLLPGHYDEWVLDERRRLAALADGLQAAADERAANVLPALGAPLHRLALYLTPARQSALTLLSAFDGGATLQAVCALLGGAPPDTAAALDDLVAISVAYVRQGSSGRSRYHAFEPVREFVC